MPKKQSLQNTPSRSQQAATKGKPKPPSNTAGEPNLHDESLYLNRELSWLDFNRRVLEEANDKNHPLLERLKFLTIFSSNLDEFFMIRVAGLMEQRALGVTELSADGMSATEQLEEIRSRLLPLLRWQAAIFNDDVMPALQAENIFVLKYEQLTAEERRFFKADFLDNLMPLLTPLALDTGHPFPRLINTSLNIAFVLFDDAETDAEMRIAVLRMPSTLPRLVRIERSGGNFFIPLEEIIRAQAASLFPGLRLRESHTFRVTRDADVEIAADEANDLITAVAEGIRQRRWGTDAVRIEVEHDMPTFLLGVLLASLNLDANDVYYLEVPLNLQDYRELLKLEKRRLKYSQFTGNVPPEFANEALNIFDVLKNDDVMVHHPFDSYANSVVKFITEAASDPHVLAIKITLYRTGGKSPIVEALKHAAHSGKNVTALVELKARFDEEANINWARELEQSGVHVVYGVRGLKVHCKFCLVIRKEGRKVLTYVHVGTGNYNSTTSKQYTDIGIFTGNQRFETDFIHLFNLLTGYSRLSQWEYLSVSPVTMRNDFLDLIYREREISESGGKGQIIAKMNSLIDPKIIRALYRASMAGVEIQLIVRGICSLRPGVPGISENISVRSILDRFLEHSRIFWFRNGGDPRVFIGSTDWMGRNFDRRVEVLFPVFDAKIKARLFEILQMYLSAKSHARLLQSNGTYVRPPQYTREDAYRVQMALLRRVRRT